MHIHNAQARLHRREETPEQKLSIVVGFLVPVLVLTGIACGWLYWRQRRREQERRRERRRSKQPQRGGWVHDDDDDLDERPFPAYTPVLEGDVWDDGGGFDPAPETRRPGRGGRRNRGDLRHGPVLREPVLRGPVWNDGSISDEERAHPRPWPDPPRRDSDSDRRFGGLSIDDRGFRTATASAAGSDNDEARDGVGEMPAMPGRAHRRRRAADDVSVTASDQRRIEDLRMELMS